MLLTLIPMYKIAKLFSVFVVGYCLVSFIPTKQATSQRPLRYSNNLESNEFHEDVIQEVIDFLSHPDSPPRLELQNSHTSDPTGVSGKGNLEAFISGGNADVTSHSSGPRNSTLGFSSITALTSKSSTWRSEGLIRAANLTNLTIQALSEIERAPEEVDAFNASRKGFISRGAAQAWMSHVRALESFLASDDSTTLILEDDADWDVNIKSQMQKLSAVLQAHYIANPGTYPIDSNTSTEYPYGYESWDIMWLGHCGGAFNFSLEQPGNSTLPYHDDTLLNVDRLTMPHEQVLVDPFFRYVYLPFAKPIPICTFAYAVNRRSAEKILTEVKREGLYEDAFDVRLYVLCRWGEIKCMSVFPELFHHQQRNGEGGGSLIKAVDKETHKANAGHEGDTQGAAKSQEEPQDPKSEDQSKSDDNGGREDHRWTENIKYSARCNSEPEAEPEPEPGPEPQPPLSKRRMRILRRSSAMAENHTGARAGAETKAEQEWKMCHEWRRFEHNDVAG